MKIKPMLAHFAVARTEAEPTAFVRWRYNDALQYNEAETTTSQEDIFSTETYTFVRNEKPERIRQSLEGATKTALGPEQPDVSDGIELFRQALETKTFTEVKAERPDVGLDSEFEFILSAATSTRIKGEAPDKI
jgi:hypothetical protein